jgi:hypothetical protein
MSIAIAPSLPRAIAAAGDVTDNEQASALPPEFRDPQGRVFVLQADPATGAPQYRHASEQRDPAGNSLALEILITLAADGGFSRRTSQHLQLTSGDSQREVVTASFGADGAQVGETVESSTRRGTQTTSERTVGTYAAGTLVQRTTDILQGDEATDPKTGEHVTVGATIRGVWDEGGAPITDATVPHVDRTDTQKIRTPGQGLHKDMPRTITFSAHGAGPLGALSWDDAGTLVVRFEGRKGQYLEREMRVPLDRASGAPRMDRAEVTRTDDGQDFVNKALMQARIWGGLASNLSWIIGLNFARGGLGRGFLGLSAAAAGAQLTGEVHAVATRRNDGDWGRVVTSGYDMLLTGLLAAYMSGRPKALVDSGMGGRMALNAAGATALALNGNDLLGAGGRLGADSLSQRLRDVAIGAQLAAPGSGTTSPLDGDWRAEPRFDAARALFG